MKTPGKCMMPLALLIAAAITAWGQVSEPSVPGDHFSLEGALELFKKSASPSEFEQLLNSPHSKVNNLDLNGDGDVDYVRVIDRNEGNVHLFILQAIISMSEVQDVAVVALEKLGDGRAVLQITGDADVYGVETIIEPTREVRVHAGTSTVRNVVNVWTWPSVQFVYGPSYSPWVSPWGWTMRPRWWLSWRPVPYYDYYPYWHAYRPYYTPCYTHRVVYVDYYRPYRRTSVVVYNRHHEQISHYRSTRGNGGSRHDRYADGRNADRHINDRSRSAGLSEYHEPRRSSRSSEHNGPDLDRRSTRDFVTPHDARDVRRESPAPGRSARSEASEEWRGSENNGQLNKRQPVRSSAYSSPQRHSEPGRSVAPQQRDDYSGRRSYTPSRNNNTYERSTPAPAPRDRSGSTIERRSAPARSEVRRSSEAREGKSPSEMRGAPQRGRPK